MHLKSTSIRFRSQLYVQFIPLFWLDVCHYEFDYPILHFVLCQEERGVTPIKK